MQFSRYTRLVKLSTDPRRMKIKVKRNNWITRNRYGTNRNCISKYCDTAGIISFLYLANYCLCRYGTSDHIGTANRNCTIWWKPIFFINLLKNWNIIKVCQCIEQVSLDPLKLFRPSWVETSIILNNRLVSLLFINTIETNR